MGLEAAGGDAWEFICARSDRMSDPLARVALASLEAFHRGGSYGADFEGRNGADLGAEREPKLEPAVMGLDPESADVLGMCGEQRNVFFRERQPAVVGAVVSAADEAGEQADRRKRWAGPCLQWNPPPSPNPIVWSSESPARA